MPNQCACGARIGDHSKSGRCRSCARRHLLSDPVARAKHVATTQATNARADVRAKRSAAKKRVYADPMARKAASEARLALFDANPEMREAYRQRGAEALRRWHRDTDRDWSAWHRKQREKALAWCPPERRDEYRSLRASHMLASEARAIIEDDERAKVRRRMQK